MVRLVPLDHIWIRLDYQNSKSGICIFSAACNSMHSIMVSMAVGINSSNQINQKDIYQKGIEEENKPVANNDAL